VHFQWTVVPLLDSLAILVIRLVCPVVLTVHDTVPFNGETLPLAQRLGLGLPMRFAARVIVHTEGGRSALAARGVPASSIVVIPHGPLQLQCAPAPAALARPFGHKTLWTFVLFGELKPYKGLDILVEALAKVPAHLLLEARVVIAGRPRMDLAPLEARIDALSLGGVVELRPRRLSDQEMADLFASADCFVFPYRQVDASGVFFLARPLGKWIIASRVGVFAEELADGRDGSLVPADDSAALALALADAIARRPRGAAAASQVPWSRIGRMTRECYAAALGDRKARKPAAGRPTSVVSLDTAMAAAGERNPTFALVTPSYANDFELAAELCRSIDQYVTGNYEHILIVPEGDLALFGRLRSARRHVHSEKQLLAPYGLARMPLPTRVSVPLFKPLRFRPQWWCKGVGRISGWVTQQLIKLSAADLTTAPFLVFIDSDVTFIRPMATASLLAPSGLPWLHRAELPDNLPEHRKWCRTAQRLLALPPDTGPAYNYVGNVIVWQAALVRAMQQRISEVQGEPWQRAVARTRYLSEYMLYGAHAAATHDGSLPGPFRPSPLTCSVWTSTTRVLAADVVAAIRPEHVALHLQSTLQMPSSERRSLCRQVSEVLARPRLASVALA
jgi:hypothetical protein